MPFKGSLLAELALVHPYIRSLIKHIESAKTEEALITWMKLLIEAIEESKEYEEMMHMRLVRSLEPPEPPRQKTTRAAKKGKTLEKKIK